MQSENFDDIAFVLNITSHLEDVLTFLFRYFMSPFFFPEVVSLNEKPPRKTRIKKNQNPDYISRGY